ncbi:MAG: acyl-CoA desaturase [Deltaproteobacteria bacterium]|nr:acyl-CoA desaturase [Deltaproteobacteria bacterium]
MSTITRSTNSLRDAGAAFWAVHVACLLAFYTGVTWSALGICLGLFWLRMFGVTAGYHRYFSHRSYKTGRVFQFLLALCGTLAVQKGVLWWAGNHRVHHKFSDQEGDVHSPVLRGFWWSHVGWILAEDFEETRYDRIPDMAKYPELRWLNEHYLVPPVALAVLLFLTGGLTWLVWGFFISTTLLWHSTFTINSLSHVFGRRRYETTDQSRNNVWLALLTMGEGWHNNHHRYMNSCRQGFFWWEVDASYYILLGLQRLGLVWDLHEPPKRLLEPAAWDAGTASVTAEAA